MGRTLVAAVKISGSFDAQEKGRDKAKTHTPEDMCGLS